MVLPSVRLHSLVELKSCREGSKRRNRRPGSSERERAGKRGRVGGELLGQLGGELLGQLGGELLGQLGGELLGQLGGELLARGGEAPITASSHARHIPSPEDSDQGACSCWKD